MFFNLIYIVKEVTQFHHLKFQYVRSIEGLLNIGTILSFVLVSFHQDPISRNWSTDPPEFSRWQYEICGCALFLTWFLLMLLFGRFPKFGIYLEIFKKVFWTFVKFFFSFLSLIFAFATSFFILFQNHRSFAKIDLSIFVKILVMMMGELEYDDLVTPLDEMGNITNGKIENGKIVNGTIELDEENVGAL